MREVERIDRIMTLLKEIWLHSPDCRFNQLVSNLSYVYANENGGIQYSYSKFENEHGTQFIKDVSKVDLYYLEDDQFEQFLINYINKLKSSSF